MSAVTLEAFALAGVPGRGYLDRVILRALRSQRLAFATLAAFLLAQPALGCAALCLLQMHPAGAHGSAGTHGGHATLDGGACHPTNSGVVRNDPVQVLSPMEPARPPVIAMAPSHRVEPVRALHTAPRLVSRTVEPPPPRFV